MFGFTNLTLAITVMFAGIMVIPPIIAAKFGKTVDRRQRILVSGAFAVPLVCASAALLTLHFFPR